MSMTPFAASVKHRPDPREGYDAVMYWAALEEYYEHSGFVNYGYWDDTTKGARSASERLMEQLLSRYIESLVYQGVVENIACEQAARMVAMKSASDNAGKLIGELQLIYNKARQAAITQELSEIVGGAAAV